MNRRRQQRAALAGRSLCAYVPGLLICFARSCRNWRCREGNLAGDHTLVVCTTCRKPGASPADIRDGARLSAALTARGIAHGTQECFAACSRGCVVALRGRGRWTYVQGALDPDVHLDDLIAMARAYDQTTDGMVPWNERPEIIRKSTIVRLPPSED